MRGRIADIMAGPAQESSARILKRVTKSADTLRSHHAGQQHHRLVDKYLTEL